MQKSYVFTCEFRNALIFFLQISELLLKARKDNADHKSTKKVHESFKKLKML